MSTSRDLTKFQPHIREIQLHGLPTLELPAGALVFVVGPNNGGKSTFLNEVQARVGQSSNTKWIEKVSWALGSQEEFNSYLSEHFLPGNDDRHFRDRRTGNQVNRQDLVSFYSTQRTHYPSFLVRLLDAQNRIALANRTQAPNVIEKTELHPYHRFFYSASAETDFSSKVKAAFGQDFRINRTGIEVSGHLGLAPSGARLSVTYEQKVIQAMRPVQDFGDGVRSYTGILLNSSADVRPVTIIDEPEAFLHPPSS